jgi:hypothetical protein
VLAFEQAQVAGPRAVRGALAARITGLVGPAALFLSDTLGQDSDSEVPRGRHADLGHERAQVIA